MAHSPEARAAVRGAYVHKAYPLEEAARQAGIPEATAKRWKAQGARLGDDWDKARAISYMAGQGAEDVMMSVLMQIVTLAQSTMADMQTAEIDPLVRVEAISRLSDAYHKTAAAIAKGSPKLNKLSVAMDVLERFAEYLRAHHPKLAPALLEVLEPFGHELAKHYQ